MFLSRACEYALQSVIFLAKREPGQYVLIKDMSSELAIPHHFLGKIMQTLVKAGILTSNKGPKGGLTLSKSPSKLTLMDVVSAVDAINFEGKCIIGLPKCDDKNPCPLHSRWVKERKEFINMLSEKSIASLLDELECT